MVSTTRWEARSGGRAERRERAMRDEEGVDQGLEGLV
jgi:hypothetical protein